MNERVKKLWVEALRSGRFKQGKKRMRKADRKRDEVRHCCLGVLEQLRCEETGDKFTHDGQILAPVTRAWSGLNTGDPFLGIYGTAASLNDGGKSFDKIAFYIEETL